jgi:peptide/nickel transport system substrate-binding protein
MKGGGDAVSAARAVLQTGEFDYAWNVLVEDEILRRLEQGGKGRIIITPGGTVEHIQLNAADPWNEVDGERASARSRHPVFGERAAREAFSLLVDRQSIQAHVYGRAGIATSNYLYNPQRYRSPNTRMEFDIARANRLLDEAGWKRGPDGIRARDGRKMTFVFQTSTNAPRQKVQAIVKQACHKAGMALELKSVSPAVFFSSDAGNNDTSAKFFCDIQMYAFGGNVDPQLFMRTFCSWEIPSRANKWATLNAPRWQNAEYDGLFRAAESELDPVKRAALFIRMNDVLVEDRHVIPVVNRPGVAALSSRIRAQLSSWSSDIFLLQDWYREG